jgi:hypothetical protein
MAKVDLKDDGLIRVTCRNGGISYVYIYNLDEVIEALVEHKKALPDPHAELMEMYAKDAKETMEPWKRWELFNDIMCKWTELTDHPRWSPSVRYRRIS